MTFQCFIFPNLAFPFDIRLPNITTFYWRKFCEFWPKVNAHSKKQKNSLLSVPILSTIRHAEVPLKKKKRFSEFLWFSAGHMVHTPYEHIPGYLIKSSKGLNIWFMNIMCLKAPSDHYIYFCQYWKKKSAGRSEFPRKWKSAIENIGSRDRFARIFFFF